MKYGDLNLGQIEALVNKIGGMEGVQRLLAGATKVVEVAKGTVKNLLERLPVTIALPAVIDFTAKEDFVVDTSKRAKVRISWLGANFKRHFLEKVEKGEVAAETLAVNKLLDYAYDPAIITELGGELKVELTLGQFFAAFAKQPRGEDGPLVTNGYANIGYIRAVDGVLWAVFGYWSDDGWGFEADPLDDPDGWDHDDRVLSR